MLHLFAAAASFFEAVPPVVGILSIGLAGIVNGIMGKNNAEKSRQLAVH
jgi:hypothetical protein